MKKLLSILAFLLALFIFLPPNSAVAQQPIPIGPGDGDGQTAPLGGIVVLAALGGGYAIKKLRDRKQ